MTDEPLYPDAVVTLSDGNAFAILGRCQAALRAVGADVEAFTTEATSGDYDHLLRTAMRWCDVDVDPA